MATVNQNVNEMLTTVLISVMYVNCLECKFRSEFRVVKNYVYKRLKMTNQKKKLEQIFLCCR